jgi:hypothetical protein
MDPAGMIVDWLSRPYRELVRPFADSEDAYYRLWRPAKPGAALHPYPGRFGSLYWRTEGEEPDDGPGAVEGTYQLARATPSVLPGTGPPVGPRDWWLGGISGGRPAGILPEPGGPLIDGSAAFGQPAEGGFTSRGGVLADGAGTMGGAGGLVDAEGGLVADGAGTMGGAGGLVDTVGGVLADGTGVLGGAGGLVDTVGGVLADGTGVLGGAGGLVDAVGGVMADGTSMMT